MSATGRKPSNRRPQSGPGAVVPRTRTPPLPRNPSPAVRTRVRRVHQKIVNQMIELRRQGFSHQEIGKKVGCSERTVRRHTKGVSRRLVHAGEQKAFDLLRWCCVNVFAIRDRLELSIREADAFMKQARAAVSTLDPLTRQRLPDDRQLRLDFLFKVVWPAAARTIKTMRLVERLEIQCGPLQDGDEPGD